LLLCGTDCVGWSGLFGTTPLFFCLAAELLVPLRLLFELSAGRFLALTGVPCGGFSPLAFGLLLAAGFLFTFRLLTPLQFHAFPPEFIQTFLPSFVLPSPSSRFLLAAGRLVAFWLLLPPLRFGLSAEFGQAFLPSFFQYLLLGQTFLPFGLPETVP